MGIDYGRSGCGPFDGMVGRRWIGYYLTAYGLAVKHGFVGTEKEWLESLIGTDGKSVDLRYNEETNTLQWRHQDAEEEWADLLDISTLQTQIVAETLADANAAKIAAEQANTQAQGAKQSSAASAGQAADSAGQAKGSADAALESAAAAAKSEQSAKEYAGKPPIVQGDTWHTWNAESQSYTDTGSKVSLTPKGEYSPDTAYTALDVVNYGGSSWMALKDVTGVAPAEGENWMLLAQKGDQGEQGIQGIQGIQGETGGPGPTGPQGASFTRLEKTAGTGAPGTTDTYTAYNSEGQAAGTVQVYNGMDGTGAGDFKADGTVPMTGNLQMAQHKVTGLADATEGGDAVNKGQMDAALAERADLTLSNLSNKQKALRNIGGMPNRNLLDNWYFAGGGSQQGGGQFPINQRGGSSYSTTGYTIDRWKIPNSNMQVTLDADGISIIDNGTDVFGWTQQLIENPTRFAGETVTFSFLISADADAQIRATLRDSTNLASGSYVTNTVSIPANTMSIVSVTHTVTNGLTMACIQPWTHRVTFKALAAKLELGPTQTLAYQDEEGNWQLFETPDYGEELAKCQRYYEQTYWSVFYAVASSASRIDYAGSLVFSVQKRIAPTSTVNPNPLQNLSVQDASNGFTHVSGCALQIPTANNRNMIAPRVTGNFTIGHIYRITVPDNAYIISAEL